MRKNGIFLKIFSYTILAMLFLVLVTAGLFYNQFFTLYRSVEKEQIFTSYQPLVNRVKNSDYDNIPEVAEKFYNENQSFEFAIASGRNQEIYATPEADITADAQKDFYYVVYKDDSLGYSIIAQTRPVLTKFHREMLLRGLLIFIFIVILCLVIAYVFTKQVADPIKRLAEDTKKMSKLEDMTQSLPNRKDELGDLSRDIHSMYHKLKETIAHQQNEIIREREMEEAQRDFFSAASHELKTPIAATSILLEGMLANIGEYKNHPKYLRECLKLMDRQSELVSEILELVKLNDGKIIASPEKVDLLSSVNEALLPYQSLLEESRQVIKITIPAETFILADVNMLRKVLSNVLANALQNSPNEATICIWSEEYSDSYRLNVLNAQAQIDNKILTKIFDPFYRGDKARTGKEHRSGLGLTIVQRLLNEMNTEFKLENTEGGVLFQATFPKSI